MVAAAVPHSTRASASIWAWSIAPVMRAHSDSSRLPHRRPIVPACVLSRPAFHSPCASRSSTTCARAWQGYMKYQGLSNSNLQRAQQARDPQPLRQPLIHDLRARRARTLKPSEPLKTKSMCLEQDLIQAPGPEPEQTRPLRRAALSQCTFSLVRGLFYVACWQCANPCLLDKQMGTQDWKASGP